MKARVSRRPGQPSGGPWATVRASGCATDKRSRERLAKLAMVASLYAQGFATGEWNANLRDESPGWAPQQFVMHVVDNVIGELQACARSGPRNASQVPPEMGGGSRPTPDCHHNSTGCTARSRKAPLGTVERPLPEVHRHRLEQLIAGQSPLRTWQSAWVAPPMQQPDLDQVAVCPGDSALADE